MLRLLPAMGQEACHALGRMSRNALQHVGKPGLGIYSVQLARAEIRYKRVVALTAAGFEFVHKKSIALCVYDSSAGEVVDERQLPNDMPKIRKYIRQVQRRA